MKMMDALAYHMLCYRDNLVMGNVHILSSPWECDLIRVTGSWYWHEYELKVSVADYRNDFQKRCRGFSKTSRRKHEVYQSPGVETLYGSPVPRPKSFSFVVPKGLLDSVAVPKHCGIIEYDEKWGGVNTLRSAPQLPRAAKLSQKQIFNLACKATQRLFRSR